MKLILEPEHNSEIDALKTMYPTRAIWIKEKTVIGETSSTCFGFVVDGQTEIQTDNQQWNLKKGNYFAFHGTLGITPDDNSNIWIVERKGYRCMPLVGTIEERGRLSYIDGCSDSVLVSMPRMGDPVLNHLHFPSGIYQTQHTHPSIRMGIVIDGDGEAFQEKSNYAKGWEKPLKKGCMFMLEEQELHSFKTLDSTMDIVAFHPDSDTGPTDENHSMINRTYIEHGKS